MSKLTSRGFSQTDADDFVARSSGSHSQRWLASVFRWTGDTGAEEELLADVPLVGGTLTLDSSDPTRRQLSLEVGGGEGLVPRDEDSPLVPFGQVVRLKSTIDRATGGWFPWLDHGLFPIQSQSYERPSLISTVECQDLSARVNEYLHLNKQAYKNTKLSKAVVTMVRDALPDSVIDDSQIAAGAKTESVTNYIAGSGSARWDTAIELCDKKGFTPFFDSFGRLVIQASLTDADGFSGAGGVGPDIGTVADPVAVIAEGPGGNLVALTATVSREAGSNKVRFNLHDTAGAHKGQVIHIDAEQTTGPVKYGDVFGRIPMVKDFSMGSISAATKRSYQTRADNLLLRRAGLARYIDLDVVGGTWLEPDDRVTIMFGARTEAHFVSAVTIDLSGQSPTRLRTRLLSVTDPGA